MVKTRALVSGGGVKPWKQKGTGRARSGSNRSPIWRGGAIIFGPSPRDYSFKVNSKVRALAMPHSKVKKGDVMKAVIVRTAKEVRRMFDQISNPTIDIFNGINGQFIGEASFTLTEAAEKALLQLVNYNVMTDAEVYAANVNSVVSINCSSATTNYFGQTVESASSGSGFIITSDGYIVTNHHVIDGASSVKVTLYNDKTYDATVIGSDEDYDIAVLKIEASGLQTATLGDSDTLNVGDHDNFCQSGFSPAVGPGKDHQFVIRNRQGDIVQNSQHTALIRDGIADMF